MFGDRPRGWRRDCALTFADVRRSVQSRCSPMLLVFRRLSSMVPDCARLPPTFGDPSPPGCRRCSSVF
eukprot:11194559-Lingulodinium_polyedra.AAC.1